MMPAIQPNVGGDAPSAKNVEWGRTFAPENHAWALQSRKDWADVGYQQSVAGAQTDTLLQVAPVIASLDHATARDGKERHA